MRTEVKIGVAIGLVVALVVVGYLVYQSHHNPNQANQEASTYNRTIGTPAPVVPAKTPEVTPLGGAPTAPTTAPAPASGIPHVGGVSFPTIGSASGTTPGSGTSTGVTTGTTGTGLRVTPMTTGTRTTDLPTPPVAVSQDKTYTIAAGDTLSSIAQKEYGEASKYTLILAANPGLDASHLKLNKAIKIPAAPTAAPAASTTDSTDWAHPGSTTRPASAVSDATSEAGGTYIVQEGDAGLWIVAKKVYGDARLWVAIEKSNHGVNSSAIRKGQRLTCPPLDEARKLAGISGAPTTRPSGTTAITADGPEATPTHASGTLAHAGTSTTAHAAAPADDGKPRFPVPD
jgi:nucleoid-associated protein YgaU